MSESLNGASAASGGSKRTPEVEKSVLVGISHGYPLKTAAALAGIDESTLHRWCKSDPDFRQALERALAQPVAESVDAVRAAAAEDWKAASWFLERRCSSEFAAPAKHQTRVNVMTSLVDASPGSSELVWANRTALRELLSVPPLSDNEEGFPPGTRTGEQVDAEGLP
jgi:hypothetical protein